ncbi:LysR family transcriptional regulator [Mesorhizobium marinum]|uniref:LysR family transcriptional regulator n=1 Tax=Mesorhizobium marinum TaxID=3228790 RepID=UPI003465A2D7
MPSDSKHSLRALQAFEAVARLGSISKAADELGVTQSAVSHQIHRLTGAVGEQLLVKSGRGVSLSPKGVQLAQKLRSAFSQIDSSVAEVIGGSPNTVRLALCSSFAPGWLVPRLGSFYAANAGIDLQLRMYAKDPELTDTVADAFISTLLDETGFWSLFLTAERLVPIAPPGSRPGKPKLITTDLEPARIGQDWRNYLDLSGLDLTLPGRRGWLFASHYVVARDMVRAGLGAALVPDFLVASDPAAGTLVLLDDTPMPTKQDYYLCIKEARRREPALDALARWFQSEVNGKAMKPVAAKSKRAPAVPK